MKKFVLLILALTFYVNSAYSKTVCNVFCVLSADAQTDEELNFAQVVPSIFVSDENLSGAHLDSALTNFCSTNLNKNAVVRGALSFHGKKRTGGLNMSTLKTPHSFENLNCINL